MRPRRKANKDHISRRLRLPDQVQRRSALVLSQELLRQECRKSKGERGIMKFIMYLCKQHADELKGDSIGIGNTVCAVQNCKRAAFDRYVVNLKESEEE